MPEEDTPPHSPTLQAKVDNEDDDAVPPAAPGTAVMPLTKEAIEKYLRSSSPPGSATPEGSRFAQTPSPCRQLSDSRPHR